MLTGKGNNEAVDDQIRMPTEDEIEHYREHGWVKLEGLLSPGLAQMLSDTVVGMLNEAMHATGLAASDEHGAAEPLTEGASGRTLTQDPWHSSNLRVSNGLMGAIATSGALGESYARLLGVRPLRLFSDTVFGLPATSRGMQRPGTRWHQDYPWVPIDRAIGGNLWLACVEITPEMGSLQYLSGSHRERPLGKHFGDSWEVGAEEVYPWILERYEISPAFHLQPGDALAHQLLTIHSSQPNRSADRDRIAWTTQRIDANALYDGKAHPATDSLNLPIDRPLDHEQFPIVTLSAGTPAGNIRML
jgi:hypothetical protein